MKTPFIGKSSTEAAMTFVLLSPSTLPLNVQSVKSSSATITVPDEYARVQPV